MQVFINDKFIIHLTSDEVSTIIPTDSWENWALWSLYNLSRLTQLQSDKTGIQIQIKPIVKPFYHPLIPLLFGKLWWDVQLMCNWVECLLF